MKYFSGGEGDNVAAVGLQELIDEVARLRNELNFARSDYNLSDEAEASLRARASSAKVRNEERRKIWDAAREAYRGPAAALEKILKCLEKTGDEK